MPTTGAGAFSLLRSCGCVLPTPWALAAMAATSPQTKPEADEAPLGESDPEGRANKILPGGRAAAAFFVAAATFVVVVDLTADHCKRMGMTESISLNSDRQV